VIIMNGFFYLMSFGKMDLLKSFNLPSRPIPTGDYWATGFFSKKCCIDKNALKVQSRDSYCRLYSDQSIVLVLAMPPYLLLQEEVSWHLVELLYLMIYS
jgi:hypothetical protein